MSECGGLCLCLFGQCVGLVEVSNHPGLMATQLWQSTQTPLRNSEGGLRGKIKEEVNINIIKSCREDVPEALCSFNLMSQCVVCVSVSLSVGHYHVPLTRLRMKLRNSDPGCDI